jgi:hypothetical protein
MTIELSWLVEKRIIYGSNYGINKITDFEILDRDMLNFLKQCDTESVHLIYDLQKLEVMPSLWESLRFNWHYPVDSRVGWHVFVKINNPLHKTIVTIVGKLLRVRVCCLESSIEALDFLQSVDNTLPNLTPYKDHFVSKA